MPTKAILLLYMAVSRSETGDTILEFELFSIHFTPSKRACPFKLVISAFITTQKAEELGRGRKWMRFDNACVRVLPRQN